MNYEVSYSRGIPPGEYTVNVHLYRNAAGSHADPVTVVASVKKRPRSRRASVLGEPTSSCARGRGADRLPLR